MREQLPLEDIGEHFPVMNQYIRSALNDSFELFALVSEPTNHSVADDQSGRGNNAAGHGIVAAIHRILDGIAQHEQQHEVKRRQLTDLPLAGNAQNNDQKDIDDESPQNEFPPREGSGVECRVSSEKRYRTLRVPALPGLDALYPH